MNKTQIIPLIAIAALLTACNGGEDPENIFETEVVSRKDLSTSVSATGTVEPVNSVDVGTQVSGIIDKLYVDFNSVVKKGQVIAELDRSTLEADLKSGQANADQAAAELKYQTANFKRVKALYEKGVSSDTEYDQAEYSYLTAKASYSKSQSDLTKLKRNLEYATITSPVDGVVLYREVEEGQTVASSYSTPTLFTIAEDLSQMEVIADVDEADIGEVKEGQDVTFTVDAYPGDSFNGVVSQVRLQPTTESNVVTYEVVISVNNDDLKLMPGMTATVTIITNYSANAMYVSSKAFKFEPVINGLDSIEKPKDRMTLGKDSSVLFVKKNKRIFPVVVKTGITAGTVKEIVEGLSVGDSVVISQTVALDAPANKPAEQTNSSGSPFMPSPPGGPRR